MASTFSSDLKLEIITTGEKAGQWGGITNTNLPAGSASTSVDITPNTNQLTLATGSVTITADCNIDVNSGLTTTQFAVDTGEVAAITWSEIIPGVTMVWTPKDTN